MPAALRLNHVSLYVRSPADSARFYQEILKLSEIENGTGKSHIRWFGLGQGLSVHLIGGSPSASSAAVSTHFCISADDFEATVDHLAETGTRYSNFAGEEGKLQIRADGIKSVYLQDPDGYWIEINDDFAFKAPGSP